MKSSNVGASGGVEPPFTIISRTFVHSLRCSNIYYDKWNVIMIFNSATALMVWLIGTTLCSMRVPFCITSQHTNKGHGISATLSYAFEKHYPQCQCACAFRLLVAEGGVEPPKNKQIIKLNKLIT